MTSLTGSHQCRPRYHGRGTKRARKRANPQLKSNFQSISLAIKSRSGHCTSGASRTVIKESDPRIASTDQQRRSSPPIPCPLAGYSKPARRHRPHRRRSELEPPKLGKLDSLFYTLPPHPIRKERQAHLTNVEFTPNPDARSF